MEHTHTMNRNLDVFVDSTPVKFLLSIVRGGQRFKFILYPMGWGLLAAGEDGTFFLTPFP